MPFGVTEHFQEGLQITPMKIMRRGVLDEHLLAFINQNLRTPEEQTGDLMAQIAANVDRPAAHRGAGREARQGESPRATSTRCWTTRSGACWPGSGRCPPGVYRGEDVIEGDGIVEDDITIRVEVTVSDGRFIADFRESDPQVLGPINCRWPSVAACVYYLLKCLVDPELPANAGRVPAGRSEDDARARCSNRSSRPPLCNANIITTQRIVDAMLRALIAGGAGTRDRGLLAGR